MNDTAKDSIANFEIIHFRLKLLHYFYDTFQFSDF